MTPHRLRLFPFSKIKSKVQRKLLLIPVSAFLSASATAYENEAVSVFSSRLSHQFENDYFTSFTVHSRYIDAFTKTERMIAEVRLGKNTGNSQFTAAYNTHFERRFAEGKEHRLWQQYRYSLPLQNSTLDFRARIEERYFTASEETGARTRLVLFWNKPLPGGNMFRFGNELVLNLNDYLTARKGFSQNRFLAGYRLQLSDDARLDFNYQYRYIHRTIEENFIQHQLQMMLTFNL